MAESKIIPEKITEENLKDMKKTITTLYFKGTDIFQAIAQIIPSVIDNDDKELLKKGVYKVASNGKIIKEVVDYVNNQAEILSEGSSSTNESNSRGEGEEEDGEETLAEVTPESIKGILEKVKAHLDVDANITDDVINKIEVEGEDNADANAVIEDLNVKLKKDPKPDIKALIDEAITATGVEGYTIPAGESATKIAIDLVTAASASASASIADSVKEVENADAVTGTESADNTDKDTVKQLLNDAKTAFDAKTKIEDLDATVKPLVEYLNAEYLTEENDDKPDITEVIKKALDAAAEYTFAADSNHSEIALDLLTKAKPVPSEKLTNNDDTDIENKNSDSEAAHDNDNDNKPSSAITVKDVTDILNTPDLVKVEGDEEKTYTIITSGDAKLQPIIDALKAKKENSKLDQVLKNAIAAAKIEGNEISKDNTKPAAEIAADLIEKANDEKATSEGGSKHSKYVYGGKTVRAYPKNISFSKKNPAKKRHNKKTIRKLQKLMNKLK
jgi:hypothetical protein